MNKLIRFGLISVTSLGLVLAGCAQQKNQASAPKVEKPKELTFVEVLQKSADVMGRGGYAYDLKDHLSFAFTTQGIEAKVPMEYHFDEEETGQPLAMHVKGIMKIADQNLPTEGYYVGDEFYQQVAGTGWSKKRGVELRPGGKDERMSDGLAMMAKLFKPGSTPNGVIMKKEANTYVLEFDIQALKTNKSFESYAQKQLKQYLDIAQDMHPNGAKLKKDQIQIDAFKNTIRIDAGTFRFMGEEMDLKASVPTSDGTMMKVEEHLESNLKGDFNGKIEVPADVKSKAKKA
jgi:uncharacterized protein involved in high-affinity Fe2+ transport